MKRNSTTSNYLTLREVQYYLGISSQALDKLLRSGELPSVRMRGVRYVPCHTFFSWLETYSLGGAA